MIFNFVFPKLGKVVMPAAGTQDKSKSFINILPPEQGS